jgi:hypothetical protein
LVFSRWVILLLATAIVLPWIVVVFVLAARNTASKRAAAPAVDTDDSALVATSTDPPPQKWTAGKAGPWGRIESMLFAIDVPDEFIPPPPTGQPPIRWFFPDHTKDKVLAALRAAGVSEDEVKKLDSSAKWSSENGMTTVEPGDRLIVSLAPEVRAKLYAVLLAFPQNAQQIDPIWFRSDKIDWRLEDCGLAADSIALLKRLLYPQGENRLLFADFGPALRSLPSDAERKRFLKAVLRKRAVLAHVKLDPETDVVKLSQYWGIGGRRKDLLPFLSALHRVEKGYKVNVVYLLPDFARDRVYRYPFAPADAKSVKQDCFWSSFNFFNDQPDNRFNDMDYLHAAIERDYYKIQQPSQLGDIVFLTTANETVVHAAVFLADDLVFTKNSEDFRQPWILMHMADMVETFAVKYPGRDALKTQFYRKRNL